MSDQTARGSVNLYTSNTAMGHGKFYMSVRNSISSLNQVTGIIDTSDRRYGLHGTRVVHHLPTRTDRVANPFDAKVEAAYVQMTKKHFLVETTRHTADFPAKGRSIYA